MDIITSTTNPIVKRLRALKDAKGRQRAGEFLVEGEVMLFEALKCGLKPACALMEREHAALARALTHAGARVYMASRAAIEAACDTKTPQGVCAAFAMSAPARPPENAGRLVVLDGVQDPGNLGAILRTADAAGLDGALLGAGCADPYSPKVQRAAMGSAFRLPVARADALAQALSELKSKGFKIIASALNGAPLYERPAITGKWALVIGNEARGVSAEVLASADMRLKIPMRGGAESLNAAVAAGILIYELTRD